jgi:hypothetical protein
MAARHRATMTRHVTEDGESWPKRAGTDCLSMAAITHLDTRSASRTSPAASYTIPRRVWIMTWRSIAPLAVARARARWPAVMARAWSSIPKKDQLRWYEIRQSRWGLPNASARGSAAQMCSNMRASSPSGSNAPAPWSLPAGHRPRLCPTPRPARRGAPGDQPARPAALGRAVPGSRQYRCATSAAAHGGGSHRRLRTPLSL